MTKDDIQGIMLTPVIILGCVYHEELADVIGMILHFLLDHI